jgi:hypothetical protein
VVPACRVRSGEAPSLAGDDPVEGQAGRLHHSLTGLTSVCGGHDFHDFSVARHDEVL